MDGNGEGLEEWRIKKLLQAQRTVAAESMSAGKREIPDSFVSGKAERITPLTGEHDRLKMSSDHDHGVKSDNDALIDSKAFSRELDDALRNEGREKIPPVYIQARSLVAALLDNRKLLKPLAHYIVEMKNYIRNKKRLFESIEAEAGSEIGRSKAHALDGLEGIAEAIKIIERNHDKREMLQRAEALLHASNEKLVLARTLFAELERESRRAGEARK